VLEISKTPRELNRGFTLNVFLDRNVNKFTRPLIKYPYILCVGLSSWGVIIQVSFVRTKTITRKCSSEFIRLQLLIVETVCSCKV